MQGSFGMIIPLVLLVVIMYFLLIRPQKKREKQVTAMRNAVKVGDEVVTIGGIRGKIVKTKDEVLTIQVGSGKTKFEIMRWAISKVENESTAPAAVAVDEETEEEPKKAVPKKMTKPAAKEDTASVDVDVDEVKEESEETVKPKKMGKPEE